MHTGLLDREPRAPGMNLVVKAIFAVADISRAKVGLTGLSFFGVDDEGLGPFDAQGATPDAPEEGLCGGGHPRRPGRRGGGVGPVRLQPSAHRLQVEALTRAEPRTRTTHYTHRTTGHS